MLRVIAELVVRQATDSQTPACSSGNDFDGRLGARISSIFVILVTSFFGAVFPVFAQRHQGVKVPAWAFFIAKYFGSGVIIATAFIHLLAPANNALTDPCLTGPITDYDWVEGIALMTIFVLFFVELMIMRADIFANPEEDLERNGHSHELTSKQSNSHSSPTHTPGEDHLGHSREHDALQEKEAETSILPTEKMPVVTSEEYAAQLTGIFILEFGIIFHSVFVGFTLAVAGPEFSTLYVVLVFHQMFEGLGLGSRLAATPWPARKWFLPYLLGSAYGLTTPIAIAVGLGIRTTYAPGSQTALIVNGVFDSISAGILIYTGLVELLAHEFMFSSTMRRASLKVVLLAFGTMVLGAGLMALLGEWA